MGKRNSKGGSKKSKSKKHREQNNKSNVSQKEEKNSQEVKDEDFCETTSQDSVEEDASDIQVDSSTSKTSSDTGSETSPTDTTTSNTDINDCCEEIKAKQQELFDKLKNLSEALTAITLIRDNVNFIRVDTLTELYFTRQVRPLLDALNIISFASYNMSYTATTFQNNAFADQKEIKNSLKLSYKMNGEVDDIINAVGRRLTIFLNIINNMDKNCPPFNSGKDS
jgi:cobalamin biosynthesis protein CobT